MMTLFSLSELMDQKKDYQKACIGIVKKRVAATIEGLGIQVGENPLFDYYYGLIDFEFFARKNIGEDAVQWMKANVHPLDIVFRLAEDHGIVLLNGGGFAAPDWSVRISFANLDDHVYDDIGRALRAIARAYRQAYEAATGKGAQPDGKWNRVVAREMKPERGSGIKTRPETATPRPASKATRAFALPRSQGALRSKTS
jgi:aspartate 4-decarboxylase